MSLNAKKYKKGYTGGVFDVLHHGHINLIKRARDLCEYLVVGVQADEYVMQLKSRPLFTTDERIEHVKSLGIADEVIVYYDGTKADTLRQVQPDVFIHGDDWESQTDRTEVINYMKASGIDKVLLPRTPGISTSDIRRRFYEERVHSHLLEGLYYVERFCDWLKEKTGYDTRLEYGTLLGCVRDHDVIIGDNDIDLCVVLREHERELILNEIVDLFYFLKQNSLLLRAFCMDGDKQGWEINDRSDLFKAGGQAHIVANNYSDGGVIQLDLFTSWIDENGDYILCRFGNMGKADNILPLQSVDFCGGKFNIPKKPEIILEKLYGDWKTPRRESVADTAPRRGWIIHE